MASPLPAVLVAWGLLSAPSLAAVPAEPPDWGHASHAFQIGNVDNMRFGLTTFEDAGTAQLFAGLNGISAGFDYNLGSGLALGVDTVNLYKDFGSSSYWLSVNPIQLKYRFGLPLGSPGVLLPYTSLGAGLAVMGLWGSAAGTPRAGIGYSASVALGVLVQDAITIEAGYGGGRVGGVTDYGLQVRMGTAFDTLGELPFWRWRQPAAEVSGPPAPGGGGGAEAAPVGVVTGVVGDRLALQLPPSLHLKEDDDVLVFTDEGITIKIARARIETLESDGRATARVLQASEPIKPGYRVRAL